MRRVALFVIRLAALLACGYLSNGSLDVLAVGPLFGAVVLLWQATSPRELIRLRALAFLAASTIVFMLVLYLLFKHDWLAILAGSILLPCAHRLLLGPPGVPVLRAALGIFCLTFLGAYALGSFPDAGLLFGLVNLCSIWQGSYLLFMRPRPPGSPALCPA